MKGIILAEFINWGWPVVFTVMRIVLVLAIQ